MSDHQHEQAIFGAGCFWGVEAAFLAVPGVVDAESGYSGGLTDNPTYKQVCSKTTGHAEVVRVTYDPQLVSFEQLVDFFWRIHDPTSINRQGPDIGSQYRSAIFATTQDQLELAEKLRDQKQLDYKKPIATEVGLAGPFWRAEEYHQRYYEKHGGVSCHVF